VLTVSVDASANLASPVAQNDFSAETPKSFDFNFSVENTPSFPAMEIAAPSSK